MSQLVVVTGAPGAGKTSLASVLAERLGCALVSLDQIKEELALDAEDTPLEWLRYDAEAELVHRLEAFDGQAVVDIWVAPRRDTERVRDLLKRWWETTVEVRCQVPAAVAVERYVARPRSWPHLPADDQTLARIRDAADHPEALGAQGPSSSTPHGRWTSATSSPPYVVTPALGPLAGDATPGDSPTVPEPVARVRRSHPGPLGARGRGSVASPPCRPPSSCCPPSTWRLVRPCSSCRASRGPRSGSVTRSRLRCDGSMPARSGSTSSTSTRRSGGATIATC